jgi:hypothetical protein
VKQGSFDVLAAISESLAPGLVNLVVRAMSLAPDSVPLPGNLVVSNVRGVPIPLYVAGARIDVDVPDVGAAGGQGLNATVVSYMSKMEFGFTVDPDLVPDVHELVRRDPSARSRSCKRGGGRRPPRALAGSRHALRSTAPRGRRDPEHPDRVAAVHRDALPRDPRRLGARQETHRGGDVFGLAAARDRLLREEAIEQRRREQSAVASVRVSPGRTEFTRTRCAPSSSAAARTIWSTAALPAQ